MTASPLGTTLPLTIKTSTNQIWESLLQIYAYVDKLRKAPRVREQTKLTDLERRVKALEDIVSSFEEPRVEAMLV